MRNQPRQFFPMHILLLQCELHLTDSHSLKEKRGVLKPLLNELRRDFNISVSEVDHHDVWQSAVLAMVAVSGMKASLERMDREVAERIESNPNLQLVALEREWL
ncbi:MAG: DUF503 domain-containing protein [Candidatus Sumerlaeia bacterium]|nr:DUF503 domain-containing protein [Candidatus Sumerlaeia bacterium]